MAQLDALDVILVIIFATFITVFGKKLHGKAKTHADFLIALPFGAGAGFACYIYLFLFRDHYGKLIATIIAMVATLLFTRVVHWIRKKLK